MSHVPPPPPRRFWQEQDKRAGGTGSTRAVCLPVVPAPRLRGPGAVLQAPAGGARGGGGGGGGGRLSTAVGVVNALEAFA